MITFVKNTENYNEKRYSKPYLAECDDSASVAKWGNWLGTAGYAGELSITVASSCILMRGQKDYRNDNNCAPRFGILLENGELLNLAENGSEEPQFWTYNKIEIVRKFRDLKKGAN